MYQDLASQIVHEELSHPGRGFPVSQCMKGGERAAVTQFMGKIDLKMWVSAQLSSDEGRCNYVGTGGCQSKRLGVHQDHGGRLSG